MLWPGGGGVPRGRNGSSGGRSDAVRVRARPGGGAPRRARGRSGAVRHRRGRAPDAGQPGAELRAPGVAGRDRRDLGPVPLPGCPVGLRHVHPGLLLQAVGEHQGHRGRARDPRVRPGDRPRVRRRGQDPLPAAGRARGVVDRGRPLDGHRRAHRQRRDLHPHLRVPADVLGLLPLRRGLHARLPGDRGLPRPGDPPAALAGGPRLHRSARRRDRQRRHGGDAGAGDGRAGRARHDAAAHADLHRAAAGARPARPRARGPGPAAGGVLDRPLEEHPAHHLELQPQQEAAARHEEAGPAGSREVPRRRASTSTPTSRRRTTRGTSASASCRTATCSGASAAATPRW
jgi:hypothetical protein